MAITTLVSWEFNYKNIEIRRTTMNIIEAMKKVRESKKMVQKRNKLAGIGYHSYIYSSQKLHNNIWISDHRIDLSTGKVEPLVFYTEEILLHNNPKTENDEWIEWNESMYTGKVIIDENYKHITR